MDKEKYFGKYLTETIRLKDYDYSQSGYYFVTICTRDKQKYFGHIEDGQMYLNEMGEIAKKMWLEIPKHFLFVKLDEYIIMPNHIHGIIFLDNNDISVETHPDLCVSTDIPRWNKTCLGLVVNQYKRACTIEIRRNVLRCFSWQSSYYERIIRDDIELLNTRQYISDNSLRWQYDREYI